MTDWASQSQVLTLWLFLYPWIIPVYGFLGIKTNQIKHECVHGQTMVPCARAQGRERWLVQLSQMENKLLYGMETIGLICMCSHIFFRNWQLAQKSSAESIVHQTKDFLFPCLIQTSKFHSRKIKSKMKLGNACYPQKLALTSPTGGGRSVGIVRVRTKATELCVFFLSFGAESFVF